MRRTASAVAVALSITASCWLAAAALAGDVAGGAPDGAALFEKRCAGCHDNPEIKAPTRAALSQMSKVVILQALEFGRMQMQAAGLSKQQKLAIVGVLASANPPDMAWLERAQCDVGSATEEREIVSDVRVANWGYGNANARFQPAGRAGITPGNVATLELAWVFA